VRERESRTKRLLCCALQSLIGFSSLSGGKENRENKREQENRMPPYTGNKNLRERD